MSEIYEGTAIDTEVLESLDAPVQLEDVSEPTGSVETTPTDPTPNNSGDINEPTLYNIDGVGSFTADQIREMRDGNLRQSDYTRKTQELAHQREQHANATELYNYLQQNPHIVAAMRQAEANPNGFATQHAPLTEEQQMIRQIAMNQKSMELDMKVSQLKSQYPDLDEVALFQTATDMKTENLDMVAKALMYDKTDMNALREQIKAELKAELTGNNDALGTTVISNAPSSSAQPVNLTAKEKQMAAIYGMSEEEYNRWKN